MSGPSALHTNILAYAEGVNGDSVKEAALSFLRQLPPDSTILPVNALRRTQMSSKSKFSPVAASP
jgi:predicted nucleic acid-binding protein